MANCANYDVISYASTLLDIAQDPDRDFSLGFDSTINVGIRSVLSYMIDPGSTGVTFKMSIVNATFPSTVTKS